jgi:hypothetical protein
MTVLYVPRGLAKILSFYIYVVFFTALYGHIISHLCNQFIIIHYSLFDIYLSMCVLILLYVFSYSLFIMTMYIFLYCYMPIL